MVHAHLFLVFASLCFGAPYACGEVHNDIEGHTGHTAKVGAQHVMLSAAPPSDFDDQEELPIHILKAPPENEKEQSRHKKGKHRKVSDKQKEDSPQREHQEGEGPDLIDLRKQKLKERKHQTSPQAIEVLYGNQVDEIIPQLSTKDVSHF